MTSLDSMKDEFNRDLGLLSVSSVSDSYTHLTFFNPLIWIRILHYNFIYFIYLVKSIVTHVEMHVQIFFILQVYEMLFRK